MQKSQKTLQQLKALKNKVEHYEGLVTKYEDILTLVEMGIEEEDESIYEEVKEMNDSFLEEYEQLHVATMLDGEYDRNNAIVTLHAGTGGTEALQTVRQPAPRGKCLFRSSHPMLTD